MRTVRLHDPDRRGTWMNDLRPGDYPVFLRDGQTWAERNVHGRPLSPGEPSVCLVFDSLEQAKTYCERYTREFPHLRCDIYDHRGLVGPPVCTFGDREWNPRPKILTILAAACLAASVPLFWFDWHKRGEMVLLSIIAINLVAAGFRFLFWAFGAIDDERERTKASAKIAVSPKP